MISSIVLAAGMSTRMGQPKSLLDWGGEPLLAYQIQQLKAAGVDEVVVVLGHRADDIHRTIGKLPCRVMLNPRYQMGRAGSLRIGAKAVDRDAEAIVIISVDQPRPAELIRKLLDAHLPTNVATRPSYGGHTGHPVVVSGRLREEMMTATDETDGLKGVLRKYPGLLGEMETDELCHLDINTPDEYEAARAKFAVAR